MAVILAHPALRARRRLHCALWQHQRRKSDWPGFTAAAPSIVEYPRQRMGTRHGSDAIPSCNDHRCHQTSHSHVIACHRNVLCLCSVKADNVRHITVLINGSLLCAGPHVHAHEAPGAISGVLGASAAAHVAPAFHRPPHAHPARVWLSKRRQVFVRQLHFARRRGSAALCLYDQELVCGPH